MAQVKSAFEKAMEKMEQIANLTAEEKEQMRSREKLRDLLASFYKGELDRDKLWQHTKGFAPSLLKEAQESMLDTLGLASSAEELRQRRDGVLAIETLKAKQNTSAIEHAFNSLGKLQKEYEDGRKKVLEELRAAIEANPQMRLRPVRTADGRTVMQAAMSVDEAMQGRLADLLSEHEKRFDDAFRRTIEKVKKELR